MKPPSSIYDIAAALVGVLDAETAHGLTIKGLKSGFGPKARGEADPMLATQVAGLKLPNPLGLAAGFDKNAEVPDAMLGLGFGFVEVGAVTPRPQPGNAKPRAFRLRNDRGVINRYGFNNDGLEAIAARLKARAGRPGTVGVNLGANKDSEDRAADYVAGVEALAGLVDFFTVNVSSPNTPGLRALQDKSALQDLLSRVMAARGEAAAKTPVLLKIAPDLTHEDTADIVDVSLASKIDGLIISNTTLARPDFLVSRTKGEAGGLSGAPLFRPSTELLRDVYQATKGALPLIGVGGVASARDAYEKILAGASLVQLYTALVYEGPGLPARIVSELPRYLRAEGFETMAQAVGAQFR